MHKLGVESTARAEFYFYNTKAEVDRFVEVVRRSRNFSRPDGFGRWRHARESKKDGLRFPKAARRLSDGVGAQ